MAILKEIFGLAEMAVNVPDEDVPAFKAAIDAAVKAGKLPPSARRWAQLDRPKAKGTTPPPVAKAKTTKPDFAPPEKAWFDQYKDQGKGKKAAKKDDTETELGIDDVEFVDDGPIAPNLPAPKSATVDVPRTDWEDDDYKSPFANLGLGAAGGSSWDAIPRWMTDPDAMPSGAKGSRAIPRGQQRDQDQDLPAVGRQWTDKDVMRHQRKAAKAQKPGFLSRIFGGRK